MENRYSIKRKAMAFAMNKTNSSKGPSKGNLLGSELTLMNTSLLSEWISKKGSNSDIIELGRNIGYFKNNLTSYQVKLMHKVVEFESKMGETYYNNDFTSETAKINKLSSMDKSRANELKNLVKSSLSWEQEEILVTMERLIGREYCTKSESTVMGYILRPGLAIIFNGTKEIYNYEPEW